MKGAEGKGFGGGHLRLRTKESGMRMKEKGQKKKKIGWAKPNGRHLVEGVLRKKGEKKRKNKTIAWEGQE